ncbi:MAG: hypothetical protein G01um101429_564 [Parcubacteria group bacterium Gr01-1014_29]|nr:MAG: hypothetical protein G01um101429_564 [Parcubacteria group bacterium Gr01-1014_29]
MARKKDILFTTEISDSKSLSLLKRIAKKEGVSTDERLDVIQSILAFSPRDWSTDEELWMLYQVALNKTGDDYMPPTGKKPPS